MKVFIIGAAGGIGRRLAARLTARGDEVTGMHRAGGQSEVIRSAGATPIAGDLIADSVADLASKMSGHDVVVFSAGAHGTGMEKTTAIDGVGLEKSVAAAHEAGVRRLVLVSAFPEAGRGRTSSEGFEHYMKVKKAADVHLAASDLDWLIVRPGTLLDEDGTGCVTAGPAISYGNIARDDVAAFLEAAVHEPGLSRVIVELTSGNEPAADAVHRLASRTV